jgi:hypothetical protein
MDFLAQLWLPIVVAAALVFFVSSLVHMAFQIHKNDKKPLPGEDRVTEALRAAGVAPGEYVFPGICSMKEMATPEAQAKYQKGPVGLVTILPNGPPAIGKALIQWVLFSLAISALTAYIAWHALGPGVPYLRVFQITGTIAWMAYACGAVSDSIWKGQPWGTSCKYVFDGLLYALVTAGSFGWLWPHGAA